MKEEEDETINTSVKKLSTSVKNVLHDEVKCASWTNDTSYLRRQLSREITLASKTRIPQLTDYVTITWFLFVSTGRFCCPIVARSQNIRCHLARHRNHKQIAILISRLRFKVPKSLIRDIYVLLHIWNIFANIKRKIYNSCN